MIDRAQQAQQTGTRLRWFRVAVVWLSVAGSVSAQSSHPPALDNDAQPEARRVTEYASGVRIDWSNRTVELEAEVVLRRGLLELLACSPGTREHESIFVTQARPLRMYEALGLIGLEPGSPVRYDPETGRHFAPRGEPLDIQVRFAKEGKERTVPAHRMLMDAQTQKPIPTVPWVFAGSRRLEDGRFAADADGTIVCLVDFDTALMTVAELRSDSNEELWVAARTEEIPPVGTRCVLLIRAAGEGCPPISIAVDGDGGLTLEGGSVSIEDAVQKIRQARERCAQGRVRVLVRAGDERVLQQRLDETVNRLIRSGVERSWLRTVPTHVLTEGEGSEVPGSKPRAEPSGVPTPPASDR